MSLTGPTVGQVVETLNHSTGLKVSTLKIMCRALGESGLLGPRGGRGKSAPRLEQKHVARILLAVLAYRSCIAPTPPQVARFFRDLNSKVFRLENSRDLAFEDGFLLAPKGTFLRAITYALNRVVEPLNGKRWLNAINAIGLSQSGEIPLGFIWISDEIKGTVSGSNIIGIRSVSGHFHDKRATWGPAIPYLADKGILSEAMVSTRVLLSLGRLFIE